VEDHWEHRCVISGVGISPIGRRTGTPGVVLTEQAAREAIADAGLMPADIDGVTTVGETPLEDVIPALGLEPEWTGEGGTARGGSMSAVHNACRAAADGAARHVLVYRSRAIRARSTRTP
jgi:3-oxoacyl-[acyl-carrier-protein] synthase III